MARHSPHSMPTPSAPTLHEAPRSTAWLLFRSLRPEQWSKNLIIFGGLMFGLRLLDPASVLRATAAFFVFCLLSGVVYLMNDIMDREADKRHPLKCRRPIASGALSPATAGLTALTLGAISLGGAWALSLPFFLVAVVYVG